MKNIITAIILILAMLVSLSSCLTAINKSGENVTDDKTDDIKESETEKENETSEQSETSDPNKETQEVTEPVQTELNEPKDDYVVLFPEEAPDYSIVLEDEPFEQYIDEIIWVQNVNGRYIGLLRSMLTAVQQNNMYGYHFTFPNETSLCVYDSENKISMFIGLDHYCHTNTGKKERVLKGDNWEPYISEKEAEIFFNNLPEYYRRSNTNVDVFTSPEYYYKR